MNQPKIMVVTGSNTGLGLALVRNLCRTYGDQAVVYLTARDEGRGQAALDQLREEGLKPAFHLLDVTDDQSVQALAGNLEQVHGGVDVLISNAAARISRERTPAEQVKHFINTNNHGTYRIIQNFVPILKDNARLIIVASSFGSLRHLDPKLHARFDVEHCSLADIEAVMDDYVSAVQDGVAIEQGWPDWINIPSKIGQVASMKIFARAIGDEAQKRGILINAACPGLVDTEASRPWFADMSSAASPDEAALDVAWLASLDEGTQTPYGELVQKRRVLRWLP
jgi:carbonyl reductase 1